MRSYTINMNAVAVTGAITLLQYKAGSSNTAKILRVQVTQSNQTSSAQQTVAILRKSGAATVTSYTPRLIDPGDSAAGGAGSTTGTGTNASGEGTNGDILLEQDFNVLNGWLYLPTPEERIIIAPSGIVGVTFTSAPGSSMTVDAVMVIGEEG